MSTVETGSSGKGGFGLAPPLLPAFLITGFFMFIAVSVMTWRHIRWQRREVDRRHEAFLRREAEHNNKRVPKLWEVWVDGGNEKSYQSSDWHTIMPLSAAADTNLKGNVIPPAPPGKASNNANSSIPDRLEVACVVLMPQDQHHHKTRCSSDTMTSNSEYAIGTTVCETQMTKRQEPNVNVKKIEIKQQRQQQRISPSILV